ncbi:MAG: VIT domain-containing protein [Crocinitomicaceae bacterium]
MKKAVLLSCLISLVALISLGFISKKEFNHPLSGINAPLIEDDSIPQPVKNKLPSLMVKGEQKSIPIQLHSLTVNTKIIGNIAVTEMDMLFYNDSSIVLSGDLYFPLNEGQTVSGFSLEVNGKLRPGVVVEKAKGRIAYETMVRRGIDPGLVELTKGNNFKTRIYPIPSKGYKRVVVTYNQELINRTHNNYYQLPLYFNEKLKEFNLNIVVKGNPLPKVEKGELENFTFKEWEENYSASFSKKDFYAAEELLIRIPSHPNASKIIAGSNPKGGNYVYVNQKIQRQFILKSAPKSICVVWDVSRSGKTRNTSKELEFLIAYLTQYPDVKLRMITFGQDVFENKSIGSTAEILSELRKQHYDGATQLGKLDFSSIKEDEVLLFSDAIHTYGQEDIHFGKKPVHVINSTSGADYIIQNFIASSSSGNKSDLTKMTISEAIEVIKSNSFQFLSYEILEGEMKEIYPNTPIQVDASFSFTGVLSSETAKIKLNFGSNGQISESKVVEINPSSFILDDELSPRLWAEKKINELNINYERNKEEITDLGKRFSIVTKNTTLLVLDRVEDYVEHEIYPPKDLVEEYSKLIEAKQKDLAALEKEKMEMVRSNWQSRIEWWNKEFKIEPPKKEKDSTYNVTVTDSNGASMDSITTITRETYTYSHSVVNNAREQNALIVESDEMDLDPQNDLGADVGVDGRPMVEQNKVSETRKKIEIKEWQADNEESKILKNESATTCYQKYLELDTIHGGRPTYYYDAASILYSKGRKNEALRVLSNLAELELENHEVLKVLANKLMEWGEFESAIGVYREILEMREEEPQSYRDLGLALHQNNQDQEAIEMLYKVIEKDWDDRFPFIENIVLGEINGIISNSKKQLNLAFMDKN